MGRIDDDEIDWREYEARKRQIPATADYDRQIMRIVEVLDL